MDKYELNVLNAEYEAIVNPYKAEFSDIIELMHLEVFHPGESIVRYSYEIDKLRFLIYGKAKITMIHEDGKCSILHFAKSGEFIGELSFLGVEDTPKDVVAINTCMSLSIPMQVARDQLLRNVDFLLLANRYMGIKLLQRTRASAKNQNYELKNRLAAYILMTECNGIYKEKHTETAEYLGTSYRHLLHTFKAFIDEGILEKVGRHYEFDMVAMKVLAKDINN